MIDFKNIGLKKEILDAIQDLGFDKPTEIQEKSIPYILNSKKDLVALAQTGTGKTAAFGLPIIQQINPKSDHVQALIICPTRELCIQITKDIDNFIKYLPDISVISIYGGARIDTQMRELKKGKNIVVGTPGRVLDLIRKKSLKVNHIQWLVIDEADEILNMGFKEDLDAILAETPQKKQTLLFSATMPSNVSKIAQKYMHEAEEIKIHKENASLTKIEHFYYMAHAKDRYEVLRRITDVNPDIYGIVFCRTRRETQEVADKLAQDHYPAEALHGDMSQEQRSSTMNRFRKKQIQLLVATDIAARGLDVDNLTHVISYNLPDSLETYIHRSGRTGRAEKSGISIVIVHMREKHSIQILERKIGKSFKQKQIPLGKEICEAQLFHLMNKIADVKIDEQEIKPYLAPLHEKLETLSKKDLIERFVSMEFNRFLSFYKNAPDLNVVTHEDDKVMRKKNVQFTKFSINLGRNNNFGPKYLIETLIKKPALRHVEIGQIEIGQSKSFFELDANFAEILLDLFKKEKFKGVTIEIKKVSGFEKNNSFEKRKLESPKRRQNNFKKSFSKKRR